MGFIPILDLTFAEVEKISKHIYYILIWGIPALLIIINYEVFAITQFYFDMPLPNFLLGIKVSLILAILLYQELVLLIRLVINFKALFITVNETGKVFFVNELDCKYHHKYIFLAEWDYCDYSKNDLERELIYLEGRLERARKPGFFDVYTFPFVILFLTAISQLLISFFTPISEKISGQLLFELTKQFTFIMGLIFIPIFLFVFIVRMPEYSTITDLKSRLLVVNSLLKQKVQA